LEKSAHSSAGLLSAYYTDDLNLGLDLEITRGSVFEFQEAPSRFSFVQGLHYDYRAAALSAAAYGEKRFDLGAGLGLNIGARAEYTHYDYDNRADDGRSGRFIRAADRKDDFFTLTPKVSLTKALGDGSLYARAARGARAPQVTDLYSAQLGQIPGEANSETLDSLEAGYKYDSENFHAQAAAFTMRKSGFFFRNANGFNVTDGKTAHEGIELSARYSPAPWITFSADATLARHTYNFTLDEGSPANNITAGTRVDSAPTALGTARLRLTPNAQITGEIEWRHVGAYFTNPGNTNRYGGHDIFVLRGGFDLSEQLRLSVRVDNLLDAPYADRADFAFGNERFFPGRPRTAFFGLTAGF
jgi:outer membrane cobalamin receptor